jgi:hypothetical protein
MQRLSMIGASLLLYAALANAGSFTLTSTVNEDPFSGNFGQDPTCVPVGSNPSNDCNQTLQALQLTQTPWNFTSMASYADLYVIDSLTVTITLDDINTMSTSSLFNEERLWLGTGTLPTTGDFCGTGYSLNGFGQGTTTLSFTLTGNSCFSFVAQEISTTGELSGAIRDASNTGPAVVIPEDATTTITIVGETPEPSTIALLGVGVIAVVVLRRSRFKCGLQ